MAALMCKFCDDRTLKDGIIFDDGVCTVLASKYPTSRGHMLIIPKSHYENIFDMPVEVLEHIFYLTKEFNSMAMSVFKPIGIKNVFNSGAVADQRILHAHMHVIPVYEENSKYNVKADGSWGKEITKSDIAEFDLIKTEAMLRLGTHKASP